MTLEHPLVECWGFGFGDFWNMYFQKNNSSAFVLKNLHLQKNVKFFQEQKRSVHMIETVTIHSLAPKQDGGELETNA